MVIATYLFRIAAIILLPILVAIVFHLIKTELKDQLQDAKKEKKMVTPPLCKNCNIVRVDEWACHHTIKDGDYLCVDCCKCPDHTLPEIQPVDSHDLLARMVLDAFSSFVSVITSSPAFKDLPNEYQAYFINDLAACQACFVVAMGTGYELTALTCEESLKLYPNGYSCFTCSHKIDSPVKKGI